MNKVFCVHTLWDEEAKVWVASSAEVPGLATEAETTETLAQKLRTLIPELLELNGQALSDPSSFVILTRR